jgi:hypothetical protein
MSHKICPICHGPQTEKYAPFCSKRCADIDLGRWLDGRYFVPTDEGPPGSTGPESETNG